MKSIKQITLNRLQPCIKIDAQWSFSGIRIVRLMLPHLSKKPGPEWLGILKDVSLKITESGSDGATREYEISLNAMLSPMHMHPVFDVDYFVPESNKNQLKALTPFFDNATIELHNNSGDQALDVTLSYEEYPGIEVSTPKK